MAEAIKFPELKAAVADLNESGLLGKKKIKIASVKKDKIIESLISSVEKLIDVGKDEELPQSVYDSYTKLVPNNEEGTEPEKEPEPEKEEKPAADKKEKKGRRRGKKKEAPEKPVPEKKEKPAADKKEKKGRRRGKKKEAPEKPVPEKKEKPAADKKEKKGRRRGKKKEAPEKPVPEKKEKPVPEKKEKPVPEKKAKKYTRLDSFVAAMRTGGTLEEIGLECERLYIKNGGTKNLKIATYTAYRNMQILAGFGFIDTDENGVKTLNV